MEQVVRFNKIITGNKNMNFGQSITACFSKFSTFSGRASRSEFWWFYLFFTLMSWAASIVGAVTLGIGMEAGATALSTVLQLIFLLPWLAVASRRMHDINKSGWWILIMFTGIGVFLLIYWWAKQGDNAENRFGDPVLQG
tara:strand:- start:27 stop:446 length:420 start_codon:yes stop_codon:yes gene_type:complete